MKTVWNDRVIETVISMLFFAFRSNYIQIQCLQAKVCAIGFIEG